MKQLTIVLFLLPVFYNAFAQDINLQFKLDSIIAEADLMYRYEKSVWNSTDILLSNKEFDDKFGGYIVWHSEDSVFVTYVDKKQNESIARFVYISTNLNKPVVESIEPSQIQLLEKELLDMKLKMINQISDSKYDVSIPQGFDPNFVFIKNNTEFKLYIIMGTSETGVIPFGNDYLFKSDLDGNITNWKKFHSRMIPIKTKVVNGHKVKSSYHSHLNTTPFITATDVCTFRLYGENTDMEDFSVLCTATDKIYTYNLKTNKITISNI